jgi:maltose O-acetyltransferase
MLSRLWQRMLDRLRGLPNTERLVAQGLTVGERTFIARTAYIDPGWPWLITIGDECTVGPAAIILAHDASIQKHIGRTLIAPVHIGHRVFVGAGAIVLPGSTIGDNSIIGAGAVVRGEIPAGVVVIGNPATVVGEVEEMAQRHLAAAELAPSWDHDGWMSDWGITEERKQVQRKALAAGARGYLKHRRRRAKRDTETR